MSNNTIPFFGIDRQYANLRDELLDATDRVYSSGQVLGGDVAADFEAKIAKRCDRRFAIAVNSCTQGLIFAQHVISINKILFPNISFAATLNSVLINNRAQEFEICDTDHNGLIDLRSVDYALNGAGIDTIMYPNLWGHTVDWDSFQLMAKFFNSDMFIIEDAAQSFGAYYKDQPSGSLGDISILSFDPTKNLPNYGSGGMILTDEPAFAEAFYNLRDNGKLSNNEMAGTNSRMSEADCAQMLVKLKHFDVWQKRRTEIANYYIDNLYQYVDIVLPGEHVTSAWHKFVIRTSNRHVIHHHLERKGVEARVHYSQGLVDLPVVGTTNYVWTADQFRESDAFTKECLSLPIYPELTDSEVEYIVETVQSYLA